MIVCAVIASQGFSNVVAQRPQYREPQYRNSCLTGTYELDPALSDNPDAIADRASRDVFSGDGDRVRNLIRRRMNPPDRLALDRQGRTITMVSSNAPLVTFVADGRTRTEESRGGRIIQVRTSIQADRLFINRMGARGRDYFVSFEPSNGCRQLRVTRRVTAPGLAGQMTLNSVYRRTSNVAQLDLFRGVRPGISDRYNARRGTYGVPGGTQIVAVLDSELDTERGREGDRFTMTVRSPSRYEGA
jgi:hypothetical protein